MSLRVFPIPAIPRITLVKSTNISSINTEWSKALRPSRQSRVIGKPLHS